MIYLLLGIYLLFGIAYAVYVMSESSLIEIPLNVFFGPIVVLWIFYQELRGKPIKF